MNGAVRPFFNESFGKKEVCESCEQCMGSTGNTPQPQNAHLKKKKRRKKTQTQNAAFSSIPKWVLELMILGLTY